VILPPPFFSFDLLFSPPSQRLISERRSRRPLSHQNCHGPYLSASPASLAVRFPVLKLCPPFLVRTSAGIGGLSASLLYRSLWCEQRFIFFLVFSSEGRLSDASSSSFAATSHHGRKRFQTRSHTFLPLPSFSFPHSFHGLVAIFPFSAEPSRPFALTAFCFVGVFSGRVPGSTPLLLLTSDLMFFALFDTGGVDQQKAFPHSARLLYLIRNEGFCIFPWSAPIFDGADILCFSSSRAILLVSPPYSRLRLLLAGCFFFLLFVFYPLSAREVTVFSCPCTLIPRRPSLFL